MLCEESEIFNDYWDRNHKIKVAVSKYRVCIISNYKLHPIAYLTPEEAIRLAKYIILKVHVKEGNNDE